MAESTQLAVLFPGQGSQTEGMRDAVESARPDLLELAVAALGEDPFDRVGEGTRFDQLAIFCASLAGYEGLGRPRPGFFAGHSLGEIGALAAAGAFADADALHVVAERGRLMQEAADAAEPGGMLALRADRERAEEIAAGAGVTVANDNAPRQVVLSGPTTGLEAAEREAQEAGVRAKRLDVGGPFHSPAIEAAVPRFRAVLDDVEVREPDIPVFSCVTCAPFDDVRLRLSQALTNPVRWLETLRALHAAGARRYLETGPGRTLSGLVRRSLDGVEVETAELPVAARG
jgi:[acyl-carrier-protein] S-malonyltransferase